MMKNRLKIISITALVLLLGLSSCTKSGLTATQPASTIPVTPTSTTSAAVAGEYIHKILADGKLGLNDYSSLQPGQSTPLPREYPGAPPLVPHDISTLTITKDQNPCMMCHLTGVTLGPGHTATKIPESHYTDLRTGVKSDTVQPLRYDCKICHLPQSAETPPLNR
jgi:nitrate reductase cytochrome c-type subunit